MRETVNACFINKWLSMIYRMYDCLKMCTLIYYFSVIPIHMLHAMRLRVSASKKCVSAFLTDYEMNNTTQVTDSKISPSAQTNQCHLFTGP